MIISDRFVHFQVVQALLERAFSRVLVLLFHFAFKTHTPRRPQVQQHLRAALPERPLQTG